MYYIHLEMNANKQAGNARLDRAIHSDFFTDSVVIYSIQYFPLTEIDTVGLKLFARPHL